MEFTIPTTKEEMFVTLREIYQHYHFRQLKYDGITLEELVVSRLEYADLTDAQMEEKARLLLLPDQDREKTTAIEKVKEQILSIKEKIAESYSTEESLILGINQTYETAVLSAKKEIFETKILDGSSAQERIKKIQEKRASDIVKVKDTQENLRGELNAELTSLETRLNELNSYYLDLHEKDVQKKKRELLDEQDKLKREVKKYNNSLDEKELRYRNTLKSNIAGLELRYLEIHEQGFAHDELVEMGYYNDVIDCVTGYYNAIPDEEQAYVDLKNEQKLLIYLDDYYSMLVQTFKIRASQS